MKVCPTKTQYLGRVQKYQMCHAFSLAGFTAYSIQITLLIMQKLVQCSATVVNALRIALPSQYTELHQQLKLYSFGSYLYTSSLSSWVVLVTLEICKPVSLSLGTTACLAAWSVCS